MAPRVSPSRLLSVKPFLTRSSQYKRASLQAVKEAACWRIE